MAGIASSGNISCVSIVRQPLGRVRYEGEDERGVRYMKSPRSAEMTAIRLFGSGRAPKWDTGAGRLSAMEEEDGAFTITELLP